MLGWSLNDIPIEEVLRLSVTSCSAERFSITFMYVLLDLSKDVSSKQLISLITALCLKLILFEVLRIKISNSQNSLFFLRFGAILLWVEETYRQNLVLHGKDAGMVGEWHFSRRGITLVCYVPLRRKIVDNIYVRIVRSVQGRFLKAAYQFYHRFMSKVNIIWGAWH